MRTRRNKQRPGRGLTAAAGRAQRTTASLCWPHTSAVATAVHVVPVAVRLLAAGVAAVGWHAVGWRRGALPQGQSACPVWAARPHGVAKRHQAIDCIGCVLAGREVCGGWVEQRGRGAGICSLHVETDRTGDTPSSPEPSPSFAHEQHAQLSGVVTLWAVGKAAAASASSMRRAGRFGAPAARLAARRTAVAGSCCITACCRPEEALAPAAAIESAAAIMLNRVRWWQ